VGWGLPSFPRGNLICTNNLILNTTGGPIVQQKSYFFQMGIDWKAKMFYNFKMDGLRSGRNNGRAFLLQERPYKVSWRKIKFRKHHYKINAA